MMEESDGFPDTTPVRLPTRVRGRVPAWVLVTGLCMLLVAAGGVGFFGWAAHQAHVAARTGATVVSIHLGNLLQTFNRFSPEQRELVFKQADMVIAECQNADVTLRSTSDVEQRAVQHALEYIKTGKLVAARVQLQGVAQTRLVATSRLGALSESLLQDRNTALAGLNVLTQSLTAGPKARADLVARAKELTAELAALRQANDSVRREFGAGAAIDIGIVEDAVTRQSMYAAEVGQKLAP